VSAEDVVSLASLAGGAAIERFDDELARVVANVLDPNTDEKATRTITLKVKVKPGRDRDFGAVSFSVGSQLAQARPVETMVFFGVQDGVAIAVENNPKQARLFDERPGATGPVGVVGGKEA
jgi:hypothetical protein